MNVIKLPDELNLGVPSSIEVFYYENSQEISRQQIVLHKNTFSFLREGTKEVIFDNSFFSIQNSQFLLMKSGHCLMTEKLSAMQQHYRSVLLFFSNETVLRFIRKFELNKERVSPNKSVYSFEYDPFIERFVNSLVDISRLSVAIQKKLLEVKFEEIMLYLTESKGTDFLFALITNNDSQSQRFTHTIERNQLNKLTLKELAFLCTMSVSTFKREFEKHYGESPIKWFQDRRLEYACRLLREELKRPSDIYLEVGYENLSSFVQAYKSKYGITPKQHQRGLSF